MYLFAISAHFRKQAGEPGFDPQRLTPSLLQPTSLPLQRPPSLTHSRNRHPHQTSYREHRQLITHPCRATGPQRSHSEPLFPHSPGGETKFPLATNPTLFTPRFPTTQVAQGARPAVSSVTAPSYRGFWSLARWRSEDPLTCSAAAEGPPEGSRAPGRQPSSRFLGWVTLGTSLSLSVPGKRRHLRMLPGPRLGALLEGAPRNAPLCAQRRPPNWTPPQATSRAQPRRPPAPPSPAPAVFAGSPGSALRAARRRGTRPRARNSALRGPVAGLRRMAALGVSAHASTAPRTRIRIAEIVRAEGGGGLPKRVKCRTGRGKPRPLSQGPRLTRSCPFAGPSCPRSLRRLGRHGHGFTALGLYCCAMVGGKMSSAKGEGAVKGSRSESTSASCRARRCGSLSAGASRCTRSHGVPAGGGTGG